MKKRIQIALFLTLFIGLLGCGSSDTSNSLSLKPVNGLVTFQLDQSTSNVSDGLQYFFDEKTGQELLFSLNTIKNEIQVFDFERNELIKRLAFDVEGPRGVGSIGAFYVHGLDSLLLFPNSGGKLFLVSSIDESLNSIEYQVPEGYGSAEVSTTFFSAKPLVKNGKLIAKTLYQGNYSTVTNQELSRRHTSYAIDLKSGVTNLLSPTFPDDYMRSMKKHFQFSFSATENGIAYSFWGDHNLYFLKDENAQLEEKLARSEALVTEWEALPLGGSRMDRAKYFAGSAHYGNIIYDPYREVYYRFAFPKVEVEDGADIGVLARFPSKFSVMVLSKDLNLIGETELSQTGQYVVSNAFVGRDGLYLSVNHPENEENEEDYLSFKLFKLK
ncbi:DUF4221 family protein [Roseivirga misakiensis]|uniref:DUF4221 domain-containing protein n=1 Tax=Roseivirga misakiensis TaxID=1563681 RepID=A0A1E5T0B1_9BACT|nr:DUF4221 family protein [Roseivirga misakiensis]OEK04818.1 hypothetical protein BFP71_15370 [Roseivirga misakiensis]